MKKFWYLGSPYAKYPAGLDAAADLVSLVAGELMYRGIVIYCPIAHGHAIDSERKKLFRDAQLPATHDFWLDQDKPFVDAACGLIVAKMSTWDFSRGLAQEIGWFEAAQKPIYYLDLHKPYPTAEYLAKIGGYGP